MVFTVQIALGRSKRCPGASGAIRGILGTRRDTPRALPGRSGTPPELARDPPGPPRDTHGHPRDAPGTPRGDRKVRPRGPESTFVSVLFGQSFARRSRNDFRTFLGHSGDAWTSISIAPASVFGRSSRFRPDGRSTTKSFENGPKLVPESLKRSENHSEIAPATRSSAPARPPSDLASAV